MITRPEKDAVDFYCFILHPTDYSGKILERIIYMYLRLYYESQSIILIEPLSWFLA